MSKPKGCRDSPCLENVTGDQANVYKQEKSNAGKFNKMLWTVNVQGREMNRGAHELKRLRESLWKDGAKAGLGGVHRS